MQAEQIEFERVTAGLKTKSDKIRALSRHGVPTAEIARYLDIRYQHARNVLMEAGLHRRAGDEEPVAATASGPAAGSDWAELDGAGRLTLPATLLSQAGLGPGPVHVRLTGDGIEVLSRKAALARAQALVAPFVPPGRSLVDEFIAERHREAERE
jgi:hypothetical protein